MSKTVKLEDSVYNRLEDFRDKRETKSQAVDRLLTMQEGIVGLQNVLEGQINFQEWKERELRKISQR